MEPETFKEKHQGKLPAHHLERQEKPMPYTFQVLDSRGFISNALHIYATGPDMAVHIPGNRHVGPITSTKWFILATGKFKMHFFGHRNLLEDKKITWTTS